ncbi:hypothetical protein [Candidatus Hodarchaeum mangrovi]
MYNNENNNRIIKYLAILYGSIYTIVGLLGIFFLFTFNSSKFPIFIDPIEQLVLILIGIIFIRGFFKLHHQNSSGKAFIFVATIIGIILGALSFFNFLFVGVINGLINDNTSPNFYSRILSYLFDPALLLGFLTFIPQRLIKYKEELVID